MSWFPELICFLSGRKNCTDTTKDSSQRIGLYPIGVVRFCNFRLTFFSPTGYINLTNQLSNLLCKFHKCTSSSNCLNSCFSSTYGYDREIFQHTPNHCNNHNLLESEKKDDDSSLYFSSYTKDMH